MVYECYNKILCIDFLMFKAGHNSDERLLQKLKLRAKKQFHIKRIIAKKFNLNILMKRKLDIINHQ